MSGDQLTEGAETFTVNLVGRRTPRSRRARATVTILDNDPTPALTVADVQITEGHMVPRNAVFRVVLSAVAPTDVTVIWATADLTATAGEDYLPSGGTLTFRRGSRVGSLLVPVVGDLADERNEAFLVGLSGAVGARIVDDQAQGVIWTTTARRMPPSPLPACPTSPRGPAATVWSATWPSPRLKVPR